MSHPSRKILAVARHEFIGTVTRLGYLLTLIGMPVFIVVVGGLSSFAASRSMLDELGKSHVIGLVDEGGLFKGAPDQIAAVSRLDKLSRALRVSPTLSASARLEPQEPTAQIRRFVDLEEGKRGLLAGEVESLVRVPLGYLQSGKLEAYQRTHLRLKLSAGLDGPVRMLRPWIVAALLQGRVDPAISLRVTQGSEAEEFTVEADGRVSPQDLLGELRPLFVPMGFSLILLLSIFTSASYLATGLAEEKQNRALEMLLTSLTPEQLFWGKLIGLWLAAFLQFALYLFGIALPAALLFASLGLHLGQALVGLAYFVLGFFFYGAVLLAVGSIGNTQKYTQQLSGMFTFLAVLPITMLTSILNAPDGRLARALTFIPFTAPITGMLRSASGALPPWELFTSLLVLALSAALVIRACAKIFRIALLSTGGAPSVRQVIAWVRE